jgi:hypothetical protein
MSNKQPMCPVCGTHDNLSVEVKIHYELRWRGEQYIVGVKCDGTYLFSEPDAEAQCRCGNCGWEGEFKALKAPTLRYVATVTLEVLDVEGTNVYSVHDRVVNALKAELLQGESVRAAVTLEGDAK